MTNKFDRTNFVKYHNPNGEGVDYVGDFWPVFDVDSEANIVIGHPLRYNTFFNKLRCDTLDGMKGGVAFSTAF